MNRRRSVLEDADIHGQNNQHENEVNVNQNIQYIQTRPNTDSFKLQKLTVNGVLHFTEKYNAMRADTGLRVPVATLLSQNVRDELIAVAMRNGDEIESLMFNGIQRVSDREIF